MELSPIEVNDKLKEVQGFIGDEIVWEKVMVAFPGWAAQFLTPYNNNTVLEALANGQFVIVITEDEKGISHSVRYMGEGICHDPKTGEEKPTMTYPNVKAMVILTHIEQKEELLEKLDGELKKAADVILASEPEIEPEPNLDSPPEKALDNKAILKQLKKIHVASLEIKRLLVI
jgi:hypothetical protein